MKSILVTGANGFIGYPLCNQLNSAGFQVRKALRHGIDANEQNISIIGNIGPETDWTDSLHGIDTVIHLASRVHKVKEKMQSYQDAYLNTNTLGTKNLLDDSIKQGVKRFIFLSSIKVNGEKTTLFEGGFKENTVPKPEDAYGKSKWEAEQILNKAAKEGIIEVVIIRPPLVYGPGVKANFLKILKLVQLGIPLPFADINNKRSLISLDNLVDIIIQCINHPKAAGETFSVCDSDDLSTTELIVKIAEHMGKRPKLFRINPKIAKSAMSIFGKSSIYSRLWSSLVVDSSKVRQQLDWNPVISTNEAIGKTVEWYLNERD